MSDEEVRHQPERKLFVMRVEKTSGVVVRQFEDRMQRRQQRRVCASIDAFHQKHITAITNAILHSVHIKTNASSFFHYSVEKQRTYAMF